MQPFYPEFSSLEIINHKLSRRSIRIDESGLINKPIETNTPLLNFVMDVSGSNSYISYGPFRCCGAKTLANIDMYSQGIFSKKDYDDLMWLWTSQTDRNYHWYFILSSKQLPNLHSEGTIAYLLNDLGAVQVDQVPNLYHNPNTLHLFRVTLFNNPMVAKYTHDGVPNWWRELSEDGRRHLSDEYAKHYNALLAMKDQIARKKENERISTACASLADTFFYQSIGDIANALRVYKRYNEGYWDHKGGFWGKLDHLIEELKK